MNRLDEPVFIAVSKPLLTEFGINHRLESCAHLKVIKQSRHVVSKYERLLIDVT